MQSLLKGFYKTTKNTLNLDGFFFKNYLKNKNILNFFMKF